MKKQVLLMTLLLMGFCFCFAQQDYEQVKREINKVKKSNAYLYGEANAETEGEARGIAEEILYKEINDWAAKKKSLQNSELVINNKKELQTYLTLPRGNMFRAFVYVKKSDITANKPAGNTQKSPTAATVTPIFPQVVHTVAACTGYDQMATTLEQQKQAGKIRHYANYGKLSNPDNYYLVIFNTAKKIVAVLSTGPQRVNVKTGQPDSVTNYSGCGAVGFSVNE